MVENGEYDFYTSGVQKYLIDKFAFEGPAITIAGNGATVGYMHLADDKFNAYQRTYVLSGFFADRYFLYPEIGRMLPNKIASEVRAGSIPYIVMDMLTELDILLPSNEEQQQIGAFFKNLDNLITLHQRQSCHFIVFSSILIKNALLSLHLYSPILELYGDMFFELLSYLHDLISLLH